jgi:thiosulfate dehydrogenase
MIRQSLAVMALTSLVASCGPQHETFAQHGADLARTPSIANNRYNHFDCLTCHAEHASDVGTRIYPGAVLEGATHRPSWWGGNVLDLGTAVGDCFEHFMGGAPLDPNSDTAQALDAYLVDLSSNAPLAASQPVPFTVPPSIHDIAPGDSTRGATLWTNTCQTCHGPLHDPMNQRIAPASIVPDDTFSAHPASQYGDACQRAIFIEKIRHGSFLGYAGQMPPFSVEVLSDAQIADLLAYIGAPADNVGGCPNVPAM